MKLTTLLLILFTLPISAVSHSQDKIISVNVVEGTLSDLFNQIEKGTDYSILYKNELLNTKQPLNYSVKNKSVSEILKETLSGTNSDFQMLENIIVIVPKEIEQGIPITGTISDAQGNPLPGANVVEKGTTNGTITDLNGEYSLTVSDENSIVVISYVGYLTQEIQVGDKNKISISLSEDVAMMDEVIVVGYGYMKKSDITGSIASVREEDFEDQPMVNASEILKGRTAGVSISQNSGRPGGDYKIRIRGANSIQGGNSPLIVLDGIQMSIGIEDINPKDIASMEVLKDASATAIYGSRGANGVILITTKQGAFNSKPEIEIISNFSFKKAKNPYELMSYADYAATTNLLLNTEVYTPEMVSARESDGEKDMYEAQLQGGFLQSYQAAVRGGTKNTTYFISGGYDNEKGVLIGTELEKYSFRSNFNSKINEKLSVGVNLTATNTKTHNLSSTYRNIFTANLWGQMEPIYNEDGTYNIQDPYGTLYSNPYMQLVERNSDNTNSVGIASTKITWEIVKGLTFNTDIGGSISYGTNAYSNNEFMATLTNTTGAGRSMGRSTYAQMNSTLTYENLFADKHRLSAMAGFEQSKSEYSSFSANGTDLATTSVGYDNLSLNEIQTISSGYTGSSLRSYMGRVNYGLNDRYLLTATLRADGSSKFRGDNKFSYFPSIALGWRLSEEEIIKNLGVFNNLKIRGSWGITGNQAISAYGTIALLTQKNYSFGMNTIFPGYMPQGASNPDLKWEETTQTNFALDASFFESRLSITIEYFDKLTSGLLQSVPLPFYNGGGTVLQNIGEISNKGFEFVVNTIPVITNDLRWSLNFNLSTLKNNVESLGDQEMIFPGGTYGLDERLFAVIPGNPLGTFYGYKHLGIWRQSEAAEAASFNASPGDNKFEDFDGDGEITSGDFQPIGNALPTMRIGFNTIIDYKNFSLNFLVDGAFGGEIYNMVYSTGAITSSNGKTITLQEGLDYWTPSNDDAKYANPLSSTFNSYVRTSQWLQKGDYVKLKNISLSYHLPRKKINFADIRVFVSAQDILTFTGYKGDDPEFTATGGSDVDNGVDYGLYPTVKTFTTGLTINF